MLPGLTNNDMEIIRDSRFHAYLVRGGKVVPFVEFPAWLHERLQQEYNADVHAQRFLTLIIPDNAFARLERFTACRYGAEDSHADFDRRKNRMVEDFSLCPQRSSCLGFCVLCHSPRTETGAHLTRSELNTLGEVASGRPDKQSSSMMGISAHTFNELKRRLFAKLNAHSKAEAISKASAIMQLYPQL